MALNRHWCGRTFDERPGTTFNNLQYPTDIVLLVVVWRIRYKLSLPDLVEMFAMRGLGSLAGAARFCTLCDELRQYVRSRPTGQKALPLADQRTHFRQRFTDLFAAYCAA